MTAAPGLRWTESELQALTDHYQRTWWQNDPELVSRVKADPFLLVRAQAGELTTTDAYFGVGGWGFGRQRQHNRLVSAQVGSGPLPAEPAAYFTIGPIGSGKTTVLRPLVQAHRNMRSAGGATSLSRIAADEVREALHEYADGLGNNVVIPECYTVTYDQIFPAAVAARFDVLYDTIGTVTSSGKVGLLPNLLALRAAGYRVHVLLADAPLPVCVDRAKYRALSVNGRLVNAGQQAVLHEQPARTLETLLAEPDLLEGWAVLDTYSGVYPGQMLRGSDGWLEEYPRLRNTLLRNP